MWPFAILTGLSYKKLYGHFTRTKKVAIIMRLLRKQVGRNMEFHCTARRSTWLMIPVFSSLVFS